jgi:adenylate cyclase
VLIADTLNPQQTGISWSLMILQQAAENSAKGEASGIQRINGIPYQLVLTPLFSPEPNAWIVIGFRITDRFSQRLAEQTHSEVSLLYKENDAKEQQSPWRFLSSTLTEPQQKDLLKRLQQQWLEDKNLIHQNQHSVNDITLQDMAYLSLVLPLQEAAKGKTLVVLQRSLDKALVPYLRLRTVMLVLFGIGLVFSIISAIVIARSLSKPLEALTETVKKIAKGDYQQTKCLQRKDELGILSIAINQMSQGLQERDQVRNLLGKVVSPEIARELLSKKIELGGEERQATILFSDIRQFTQLCEDQDPKAILHLLNRYLSGMSDVIEQHHGVIDKYIGDAIMALFNVPVSNKDSAEQAVNAALNMVRTLSTLNKALLEENIPSIRIGIGIHSGEVVAGNMGSENRLNYTVIGDSVNLASRLEGLTKYFGVSIIVSESTAKKCSSLYFKELGRVQVKGKENAITIFEPLPPVKLTSVEQWYLRQYEEALQHFRQQNWQEARLAFQHLKTMMLELNKPEDKCLHDLYLENIEQNEQKKLPQNWQGTLVFVTK